MGQYSIGEALNQFLNESRIKGDIQSFQIEDIWESLMGKTIARHTDKIQIIDKKLIITTSVAALKNELIFQREKIIGIVNEAMKNNIIDEVVVR
jgi:predicted nucleic acid-binding Zn ribbon protein